MIDRRTLFGGAAVLAAGAAIGIGGSLVPDGSYERALAEQLAPLPTAPALRDLVRYATLAANSHNTQPWRFRISERRIVVAPDPARRTPVVDPDDHHLYTSLGCAAENLSIAARGRGRGGEVFVDRTADNELAVSLAAAAPQASVLFDAIPQRQCSRSTYDGSAIPADVLRRVETSAHDEDVDIILLTDGEPRERVLELILAGNRQQLEDPAFRAELKSWLRFNPKAAARTRDGLLSAASGNPNLPTWLGPLMFDLAVRPAGDNDRVAKQVRSSAGLAIFVSRRQGPTGWIAAGRTYQRFALAATVEGIQHAFLNQAVEVPAVRAELEALLGTGGRRADLIVRFGHGPTLPRSLRRPVDEVIVS